MYQYQLLDFLLLYSTYICEYSTSILYLKYANILQMISKHLNLNFKKQIIYRIYKATDVAIKCQNIIKIQNIV